MKLKLTLVIALFTLLAEGVNAQKSREPYSFVELQGGTQFTASNADFSKLLTPSLGLSIGHYAFPYLGGRIHLNGYEAKGRYEDIGQDYKWRYINTNADLLVNISQIFSPGNNPIDFIFLAGLGLNYAWHNNDLNKLDEENIVSEPLRWKSNQLMHNIRAGLRLETNTHKNLGLSLELTANNTSDKFNSKHNNSNDWQFVAMLGINYRFGRHIKQPEVIVEAEPVVTQEVAPVQKVMVKKVVKEDIKETLHVEVFYAIRDSLPDDQGRKDLKSVADFIQTHKDVTLTISGYADKGTGNARVNLDYSQRRTQSALNIIAGYGCDTSSISVESFGDTIQPFTENDKNRCVIIKGNGIRSIERTIEVEE